MTERLKRYALIARVAGIIILVIVLGVVIYQLYDFYSDKVGATPAKAIETYFSALGQGKYDEVYRLTAKETLTDIYGRRMTEGEFISQLKKLTGDRKMPFSRVEVTRLCDARNARYYQVTLHSVVGGTSGQSRLIVEVRRQDNAWIITYPFAIVL